MSAIGKGNSSTPIIAVTGDLKEFETYQWHAVATQYLTAAIDAAALTPLIVPALGGRLDLDAILDRVDGVLCTGSKSNVHPSLYGATPTPAHEPYDRDRDATSLPLIRKVLDKGVPLFCICRGMQELNVALGGSLMTEIQELDDVMDHRAPVSDDHRERFAIRHSVAITPGSTLGHVLTDHEVHVNSLHRQAVATLADDLTVEARATDGTIEAVSVTDAIGYAVAVQWHPEFWATSDGPSRRLFEAFGKAVREYQGGVLTPLKTLAAE